MLLLVQYFQVLGIIFRDWIRDFALVFINSSWKREFDARGGSAVMREWNGPPCRLSHNLRLWNRPADYAAQFMGTFMGYYWHISEPFLRIHVFLGILIIISSRSEQETLKIDTESKVGHTSHTKNTYGMDIFY